MATEWAGIGSAGRTAKAERLAAIAEAHYQAAPDDDEPLKTAASAAGAATTREYQRGEHDADD